MDHEVTAPKSHRAMKRLLVELNEARVPYMFLFNNGRGTYYYKTTQAGVALFRKYGGTLARRESRGSDHVPQM